MYKVKIARDEIGEKLEQPQITRIKPPNTRKTSQTTAITFEATFPTP